MSVRTMDDVTCLGCGCACDDIRVVVENDRIIDAENACPLGRAWFGDGLVPTNVRAEQAPVFAGVARDLVSESRGSPRATESPAPIASPLGMTDVSLEEALDAAASLLIDSARPLVYLTPALSCEAQREAAAVADLLHARLDTVTSSTALPVVIAAQERGFASATFGEIRNGADVVVFWAIDVARRYPRFASRYAPNPVGLHLPAGRGDRHVVAVDVGAAVSTVADANRRVSIGPADELAVLLMLQALVREPTATTPPTTPNAGDPAWVVAREIAALVLSGRYVALVFDAEPDDRVERSAQRFDALFGLSHALNQRTRCAAIAMRAGGNRSGADAVLTAATGYPIGIDFGRGYPRYDPFADSLREHDVALVVGDASQAPQPTLDVLNRARAIVIGPFATATPLGAEAAVAIDTGVAGIHVTGTGYRADDVPLPLRAPLGGRPSTAEVVRSLALRLHAMRSRSIRRERVFAR